LHLPRRAVSRFPRGPSLEQFDPVPWRDGVDASWCHPLFRSLLAERPLIVRSAARGPWRRSCPLVTVGLRPGYCPITPRSFGPDLPGSGRPVAPSSSPGVSRVHSSSGCRRRLSPPRLSVARCRRVLVPVIDTYEYGCPSGVAQRRALVQRRNVPCGLCPEASGRTTCVFQHMQMPGAAREPRPQSDPPASGDRQCQARRGSRPRRSHRGSRVCARPRSSEPTVR